MIVPEFPRESLADPAAKTKKFGMVGAAPASACAFYFFAPLAHAAPALAADGFKQAISTYSFK